MQSQITGQGHFGAEAAVAASPAEEPGSDRPPEVPALRPGEPAAASRAEAPAAPAPEA